MRSCLLPRPDFARVDRHGCELGRPQRSQISMSRASTSCPTSGTTSCPVPAAEFRRNQHSRRASTGIPSWWSACSAAPVSTPGRRFQEVHPGVVWLAQYTNQGLDVDLSHQHGVVKAPRTLILDETLQRFREKKYVLPQHVREIEAGDYFRHLQAPVRTTELDSWDQPVAVYKNRQPDDFAHAEGYATLATIRAKLSEGWIATIGWGNSGPQLTRLNRSDYAHH